MTPNVERKRSRMAEQVIRVGLHAPQQKETIE